MAFDRTDPADLLALKTEYTDDPIGMGYAGAGTATVKIIGLFNDPESIVGLETIGSLSVREFLLLADPSEISAQQVSPKIVYAEMLMNGSGLDADISEFLPNLQLVFATQAANTLAGLNSAIRTMSRAEVLFGAGTSISRDDWYAARDS